LHDPAWQVVGAQEGEAPVIHGNSAAEASANPSGSSVNITDDAGAIIIPGLSQASAQQARDASAATFGGDMCCDSSEHKAPHISQAWHDSVSQDFHSESSCQECAENVVQSCACLPSLPVRGKHRCDAISLPPCAKCLTKRSCTRGVPTGQRSFLASRGGGVEGSEDFRNNPHLSLRLPAGGTHAVNIEVSDVPTLLRHCSKKKNVQPAQNLGKQSGSDLEEEFAFIPPLLLASLLSHYQDALSLQCLVGVLSLGTVLKIDFCKFVASRHLRSTKAFKELWKTFNSNTCTPVTNISNVQRHE
jgi:hypothetical protein